MASAARSADRVGRRPILSGLGLSAWEMAVSNLLGILLVGLTAGTGDSPLTAMANCTLIARHAAGVWRGLVWDSVKAGSEAAGSRRGDRDRGVVHGEAAPHRAYGGADARQQLLLLGWRDLAVAAGGRHLFQPLVAGGGAG